MDVRNWKWTAPNDRIARRAYFLHVERNRLAGCVVHGHDQSDYDQSLTELTFDCGDAVVRAELQVCMLGFRTFSWWDVMKWNQLVIKFLSNDYFPLLRTDDMTDYGDRIIPFHAFDLLLQQNRIAFRHRGLTEEEWDELLHYRKMVGDSIDYAFADYSERKGDLATKLTRKDALVPLHDVNYIWEGEPYESVVYPLTGPFKAEPNDHLERRMPKPGEEMILKGCNEYNAHHPTKARSLAPGDKIKVNRLTIHGARPVAWYYWGDFGYEAYVPIDALYSPRFNLVIPKNWSPFPKPPPPDPIPDNSYRTKCWGLNAFSDCIGVDPQYRDKGYRVLPSHLAELIGLRFLDLITSQQAKILLERIWDNFGWYDVFYHIRELQMFEEVSGDLRKMVEDVLKEQEQAVKDYKSGKKAAFGQLMGSAMKASEGRAKPNEVRVLSGELLGD